MNINEIIERDIADEERRQALRGMEAANQDIGDNGGLPWLRLAVLGAVLLAMLGAAFAAGAAWAANDARRRDDAFNRFLLECARAAERNAAAMTNTELLRTERECAPAN